MKDQSVFRMPSNVFGEVFKFWYKDMDSGSILTPILDRIPAIPTFSKPKQYTYFGIWKFHLCTQKEKRKKITQGRGIRFMIRIVMH